MTNNQNDWQTLVSKAREESAPALDVTAQVVQRIAHRNTLPLSAGPTWTAAALSIAAAVMMMATVLMSGVSWNEPLGDWFSSFFMVMS